MKITPAAANVSLYLYERMQQMLRLMCVKKTKTKQQKKKNRFMEMIRASCLETQSVPLWDWTYSKYVGFRTF